MDYNDDFIYGYSEDEFVDISYTDDGKKDKIKSKKTKKNKKEKKHLSAAGNKDNFDDDDGKELLNGGNKKASRKKSRKKTALIIAAAAVVVIAAGAVGFCFFGGADLIGGQSSDEVKEFTFAENTYVSDIAIGGKTVEEAKALLEDNKESFVTPVSISVDIDGEMTLLTEDDFEYTYNIDEVLEEAKTEVESATTVPRGLFEETTTAPVKNYYVAATVTKESVEAEAAQLEQAYDKDAQNAYVSNFEPYAENRFTYEEAVDGQKLDGDDLASQIAAVFDGGISQADIVASTSVVEPTITVSDLKEEIVKLSTYETVSTNTANGTENMRVSLAACNGSIIEPGEVWSFNGCTGDSNLESNGYKSAGVISDGEYTSGIGGGLCQSSSTIYNAAIRADLTIEERYNHRWASSYVPTGLDATIDYPNLDLKLSNPTDYQVFIECKLVGSTLTCTIWGYKSPDYDYIATDNELYSKGSSNYVVKAWKIYYKDGKEIERVELGSSSYNSSNGYVFISADNDTRAKDVDYVVEDEDSSGSFDSSGGTSSSSSSASSTASGSSSSSSSSSSRSSSSSSPQQTSKPASSSSKAESSASHSVTEPQSSSAESSSTSSKAEEATDAAEE